MAPAPPLCGIPEQRAGFVSSPCGPGGGNGGSSSCPGPREEEPALRGAVELLPGRLLFAALRQSKLDYLLAQGARASLMPFCVDQELVYEPLQQDFGPLNLSCIHQFCTKLDLLLHLSFSQRRPVVFCCSSDPKKKANAAVLVAAFLALRYQLSAKDVCALLAPVGKLLSFRDASKGGSLYTISVKDCIKGLCKALGLGWLERDELSPDVYSLLHKACLSWMVPGKILAFSSPSQDGLASGSLAPEHYIPYFKKAGIKAIIRLNRRVYDKKAFTKHGFAFYDLPFADGRAPPEAIRVKFLSIVEAAGGPVAVHCKAGLGRTGVLVGCYIMKHFGFGAAEAIGYMRIIRPGSVIGLQQPYLEKAEPELWKEGEAFRKGQQTHNPIMPSSSNDSFVSDSDSNVLEVDPTLTVTPEPAAKPKAAIAVALEAVLAEGLLGGIMRGQNSAAKVHSESQFPSEGFRKAVSLQHSKHKPTGKTQRRAVARSQSELCSSPGGECSAMLCSDTESSVYASDASECKSDTQVGQLSKKKKTRARRPSIARPSSRSDTSDSEASCEPSFGAAGQSSRITTGHDAVPGEERQARRVEGRSVLVPVPEHSPASSSEFLSSSGRLLSPASSASVAQKPHNDTRQRDPGGLHERSFSPSTRFEILRKFFRARLCGTEVLVSSSVPSSKRHAVPRSRHSATAAGMKPAPTNPGRYRPVPVCKPKYSR